MDPAFRAPFNAVFSLDLYLQFLRRLERELEGPIPFRVAETPLFLPTSLRDDLAASARAIVDEISDRALIEAMTKAVPQELDVPRRDDLSSCIQVDFAITRNAVGQLEGKLVELQGFPSLYCFTLRQTAIWNDVLRAVPGLDRPWTSLFSGMTHEAYVEKLRRTVLGENAAEEVILMDLAPERQKTSPDFVATKQLLGIDSVCPTSLERDGRKLIRRVGTRRVPVRRIYNRVVFDELLRAGVRLPFSYTEDLDVSWVPHPNWYWIWSKYTVPFLKHPSVPRARFVSDLRELPDDLSHYVLKPLFSFAGAGVKVDVTAADIESIPASEQSNWILQEKIHYAPDLRAVDGQGVKAEVRMMFLRAPGDDKAGARDQSCSPIAGKAARRRPQQGPRLGRRKRRTLARRHVDVGTGCSDADRGGHSANRLCDFARHFLLQKVPRVGRGDGRLREQRFESAACSPQDRIAFAPDDRRRAAVALHEGPALVQGWNRGMMKRVRNHAGERERRKIVAEVPQGVPVRACRGVIDAAAIPLREAETALRKAEQAKHDVAYDGSLGKSMKRRWSKPRLRRGKHGVENHQSLHALRRACERVHTERPTPILTDEHELLEFEPVEQRAQPKE